MEKMSLWNQNLESQPSLLMHCRGPFILIGIKWFFKSVRHAHKTGQDYGPKIIEKNQFFWIMFATASKRPTVQFFRSAKWIQCTTHDFLRHYLKCLARSQTSLQRDDVWKLKHNMLTSHWTRTRQLLTSFQDWRLSQTIIHKLSAWKIHQHRETSSCNINGFMFSNYILLRIAKSGNDPSIRSLPTFLTIVPSKSTTTSSAFSINWRKIVTLAKLYTVLKNIEIIEFL